MDRYNELFEERGCDELPENLRESMGKAALAIDSIRFDDETKRELMERLLFNSSKTVEKFLYSKKQTPMQYYDLIARQMEMLDDRNETQEGKQAAARVLMDNYERAEF